VKKNLKLKKNSLFLNIVNKILLGGGIFFFLFFFILVIYYFSSGLNYRYGPSGLLLKINTVIFDRYLGINFLHVDDYIKIIKIKFKYLAVKPKTEKLQIEVDPRTIIELEDQRKKKLKKNLNKFSKYNILINHNDKKLKAKIRLKGDRSIHWLNRKTISYKIDMRGNNKIWGLEKFSIQKPIVRNYTYEHLFHKFLDHADHISLKYFFINLYFNNDNRGLYAIEEGISSDLLERHKKRNGPIFGLDELTSSNYPNVQYDLYESDFWANQNSNLTETAFSILNNIRDNEETFNIEEHFDIDKWASFFAAIDLTGTYHGSIPKSVKLYFNPISAKFEPVGFDGHYGIGNFENFILSDFLQDDKVNCSFICDERNWYLKFFKLRNGELNTNFLKKYIFYLKKYSDEDFVKNFLKINKKQINKLNTLIYSENSKSDKGLWVGIAPFIFDETIYLNRAKLINDRINSINFKSYKLSLTNGKLIFNDTFSNFPVKLTKLNCKNNSKEPLYLAGRMSLKWSDECKKISLKNYNNEEKIYFLNNNISMSKKKIPKLITNFKNLANHKSSKKISENVFEVTENLILLNNTYISKKQNFFIKENVKLELLNDAILFVRGNISFEGSAVNKILIKSDGSGSIVFENNEVKIKHANIENLGYPKIDRYILYGGLNFLKANVVLEDVKIKNSKSEDALNFFNSEVYLKNIHFKNIQSDAIDVDFGLLNFNQIDCLEVKSDCVDLSGVKAKGSKMNVQKSYDKGLSVGENSEVNIKDLNMENSRLAVAIKDGSKVYLENIKSLNNDYDIALFNKKNRYKKPSLEIKNFLKKNKKILQSKNSSLKIDEKIFFGSQSNEYINSILY